ncbi:MAG TPA: PP2C family serine/threonine-protein phosphatase [Xanthobacteraceae bacterium]|nr:PP2C family serine/threonine-protein phosphatase [Xanthobacteraceae bacterium]
MSSAASREPMVGAEPRGEWLVTKASVRGRGHITQNTPCQDAYDLQTTADGLWLAAVVSDGAGSAARAAEGSRLVASSIAQALIAAGPQVEKFGGGWLKDRIQASLIDVRQRLRERGALADFHCTLVGLLIGPPGGVFIHIGDGAALASKVAPARDEAGYENGGITLWNEFTVSAPENGDYSNETFFVTEDDWDKHLRKTILPTQADLIALMSDGAMPFVLQGDRPYCPFVEPLVRDLLRQPDPQQRDALLEAHLSRPENDAVTDDDKTLVFIARRSLGRYGGRKIVPSSFPAAPANKDATAAPTQDSWLPRRVSIDEPTMNKAIQDKSTRPRGSLLSRAAFLLALISLAVSCFALYAGRKVFFGPGIAPLTSNPSASTTKDATTSSVPAREAGSAPNPAANQHPTPSPSITSEPKPPPSSHQ